MDVFDLRDRLVADYAEYTRSFITIADPRIRERVDAELDSGLLWPDPIVQLNPSFAPGATIDELVAEGVLHDECRHIFRRGKGRDDSGAELQLHRHQADAIRYARGGASYVVTTGTGSGKSLTYIIPIVDRILREGAGRGIQALIVYPMNALANSQAGELRKFLTAGYPAGDEPVRFARYTGQEGTQERAEIIARPPDILITNYAMLELILTRPDERGLVGAARGLRFLVLDELHTYRGRQGADVALLARRVREACAAEHLQCVGTSATLAGDGTPDQQRDQVAEVATRLFGATVAPDGVIRETLIAATRGKPDPADLATRIADPTWAPPADHAGFIADPMAAWVEENLGLRAHPDTGDLVRATPRSILGNEGAAARLAAAAGTDDHDAAAAAIRKTLMTGYVCLRPDTALPVFAFRVHQFFSRGETVHASLEDPATRHLTTRAQRFVPGDRERRLYPLAFCRECGQEYYTVRLGDDGVEPRDLDDALNDEGSEVGFVYQSDANPWPQDLEEIAARLPEHWLTESGRVTSDRRKHLPQALAEPGVPAGAVFIPSPFRFCLNCGVSYAGRTVRDYVKLATLGAGGRSSATTILSLAALRTLRREPSLERSARKLLSFTDNRQDASLQAGHFNDFVEVALLRSALHRAVAAAGEVGVAYDDLAQRVFAALDLDVSLYALTPDVRYVQRDEADRAFRDVIGYRLYRDLQRGWRITAPNLEQTGLLQIRYVALERASADAELWADAGAHLYGAASVVRAEIARVLLDFMRRELAVRVDYLDRGYQEGLAQRARTHLKAPWALDDQEQLEYASVVLPRPRAGARDDRSAVYLSPRGGFGQYLRRRTTFPDGDPLSLGDTQAVIVGLLEALRVGGFVQAVSHHGETGFQVSAAAMRWHAGDGSSSLRDPIRVPNAPRVEPAPNRFFQRLYREAAGEVDGLEAREHTAQVPAEERQDRETRFRAGTLPLLFSSPTMELGVDIADLNVVSMRNVPPTPANYAQRSGRAGRSGQPALVFNYCAQGSSHDQYFFRQPARMVSGQVQPPRLDLANEDLVRAHVHALWLAETGQSLGKSLAAIVDVDGGTLDLQPEVRHAIEQPAARARALGRATALVDSVPDLAGAGWFTPEWVEQCVERAPLAFDQAIERWRTLYRAAGDAQAAQNRIATDASRGQKERDIAKGLRREAESQLELLRGDGGGNYQSDFYSYRYFASEGFLPGYSFPRRPLSAFIPGRGRSAAGRDEFLSRPRFLAISEFGPRTVIYHEGSRYQINRVFLPSERTEDNQLVTEQAKQCGSCGQLHPLADGVGPDLCTHCGRLLDAPMSRLFRLRNVSTKRRDRINSDEENRTRQGFEVRTGVRFAHRHSRQATQAAQVTSPDGLALAQLTYGQAATLWRINLGWSRRKEKALHGFLLDTERGLWANNDDAAADDPNDAMSQARQRVIPYVEDTRNVLLIEPAEAPTPQQMASLAAALKHAIQIEFQLEDTELAAEPLPSRDQRRLILLYEAAEGGAGALRRLVSEPDALARVARQALEVCHYDPVTREDRRRAPGAGEDCEAACYDCLMSYSNQPDHDLLDRTVIRDLLLGLAGAEVAASPVAEERGDHMGALLNLCGSGLERRFLELLDGAGHSLPSDAQPHLADLSVRPDFLYRAQQTAVFIDGPHHRHDHVAQRDAAATERLEDAGWQVVRFGEDAATWPATLARYPSIFGAGR